MNRFRILASCALAAMQGLLPAAANAAIMAFAGTRSNTDAPGPAAARCGARTTVNIRNSANSTSTGTSNFGSFDASLSHCIQLPLPANYDLGEFVFAFVSGDTLFGTQSGSLTVNSPGLFNNLQNYVVTGGTGLFAGATGSFTGIGTLSFVGGPPHGEQSFSGLLDIAAVPEPSSWAMLITGFGLSGGALRRRRNLPKLPDTLGEGGDRCSRSPPTFSNKNQVSRCPVTLSMFGADRLRDRDQAVVAQGPGELELRRSGTRARRGTV